MGRYTGSKAKLCKRVGVNIFNNPKYDNIIAKHFKTKRRGKVSEYASQLKEKQVARYMYGLSEKQFYKYFKKSLHSTGVTGTELLTLLEKRVDNVLYRAGVASSRGQARQMVSHGHFELNGHKITVPSIIIKEGDKLVLRKKMLTSPLYVGFGEVDSSKWLKLDKKQKTIEVSRFPEEDELEKSINVQLVVEYYSR